MTENNLLNQYSEAIIEPERLDNCPVDSEIELKFVENIEGFLSQEISQDRNNSPSDILKTKKKLKKLKYYKEDDKAGGMHGYPDKKLFKSIKKFQKDNDLKVDGKMKPKGETEENLVRKIWQKQQKESDENDNKIRKNRNNHFAKVMNKAKKELELNSDSQEIIEEKPAEKTTIYRIGSNLMKKKNPEKKKIFDFENTEEVEKILHVSSNLMKKKEQNENEHLLFNGKSLQWIKNGKTITSWKAMSGKKGFQSKKHTDEKDKGPIPEGEWSINRDRYQKIDNLTTPEQLINLSGFGKWPGGESSWGKHRIWIEPRKGTDAKGRANFSIHGGDEFGSSGCIDLTKGIETFIRRYKRYGKDIKLKVKYGYRF